MEIRSYRAVFDLERRIYRVDRVRLNPGGVPVRGIVYYAAIALIAVVLSALPGVNALDGVVPWYLRELALPGAMAALLSMLRIDGRPFHMAATSLLAHAAQPRQLLGSGRPLSCARWHPRELLLLPDGSEARMRRVAYYGPGAVLVAHAHRRWELGGGALWRVARRRRMVRRPQLILTELPGRLTHPQVIELGEGVCLRVR